MEMDTEKLSCGHVLARLGYYCSDCRAELEAELARVREELEREYEMHKVTRHELDQSYADYDLLHAQIERVARRAAEYAKEAGVRQHIMDCIDGPRDEPDGIVDEAVEQAMREVDK